MEVPVLLLKKLDLAVKHDVRTTTGSNLRNILLKTSLTSVYNLHPGIVQQIKYEEIREIDRWRVPIIQEAMDIKCGKVNPPVGWTVEELDEILNFACTE